MNTQTAVAVTLALLLVLGSTVAAADAGRGSEVVFVHNGQARSVREIGDKWTTKEGALVCGGTGNFLVAGKALGAGDFRIRARLSLERLDGTAASVAFGQNHFGFDGRSGKLFVEGAELGSTRSVGYAADFIAPGRPFDVEVVRHAGTLSFRIDGKEVHRGEYRLDAPLAVALRPWRATMAVTGFSASGNLVDVTGEAIAKLRRDWKQPHPQPTGLLRSVTVGGMKIDATAPPVGLVVRPGLGLLTSTHVDGQLVHEAETNLFETRATITPGGDYLLMFPEGEHYGGKKGKVNTMIAYRSSDKGRTWEPHVDVEPADGPEASWVMPYLTSYGRVYVFYTYNAANLREVIAGNAYSRKRVDTLGEYAVKYSDDGGKSWSKKR